MNAVQPWQRLILMLSLLALAAGCAPPEIYRVYPASCSSFGYTQVKIYGANLDVPGLKITIDGIPAIVDAVMGPTCVRLTVQGGPHPGPVDVLVETAGGRATLSRDDPEAFSYLPPVDSAIFARFGALGASFGFGIQTLNAHPGYTIDGGSGLGRWVGGMLASPVAYTARQAGAFMPLPMVMRDGFPGLIKAEDVQYAHAVVPDPGGSGQMGEYFRHPWTGSEEWRPAGTIFNPGQDFPELNDLGDLELLLNRLLTSYLANSLEYDTLLSVLRLSPDTITHNVSVPTAQLIQALHGSISGSSLIAHIILNPHATLLEGLTIGPSQVKKLVEQKPTVIMSCDLYGNSALFSPPSDQAFMAQLLLTLLDLALAEFLVDPEAPVGTTGIPYVDILPESGEISHDFDAIKWSPFVIDWDAIPEELVPLMEDALAWMAENDPNFGEWSIGWQVDPGLVPDFTRISLPAGQPLATIADDLNGDGWVDGYELLPLLDRAFAADPDPADNPYAIFIADIIDLMVLPDGRDDKRMLAIRFNEMLYDCRDAINAAAMAEQICVTPLFDYSRSLALEDKDCGAEPHLTDLDGDAERDIAMRMFGGIVSPDGLHFTNTGYAILANQFIQTMNERLFAGEEVVPLLELSSEMARDYLALDRYLDWELHDWAEDNYESPCIPPPSWGSD